MSLEGELLGVGRCLHKKKALADNEGNHFSTGAIGTVLHFLHSSGDRLLALHMQVVALGDTGVPDGGQLRGLSSERSEHVVINIAPRETYQVSDDCEAGPCRL